MHHSMILSKEDAPHDEYEAREMEKRPYHELIGALIWISLISRPDISFVASYLSQYSTNPGCTHWYAVQ